MAIVPTALPPHHEGQGTSDTHCPSWSVASQDVEERAVGVDTYNGGL